MRLADLQEAKYASRMEIIQPANDWNNWVKAIVDGFFVIAKVFAKPSGFGINSGRVSKLAVVADDEWNPDKVIINYDRGWDTGEDSPYLDSIVAQLEDYAKTL
jgi:hypothetical protein